MRHNLHPATVVLKEEIHFHRLTYGEVAQRVAMPPSHLKNLMNGRARLTLEDRDLICLALNVSPTDMTLRQKDARVSNDFVDIRPLSPETQDALRQLVETLMQEAGPIQERRRRLNK